MSLIYIWENNILPGGRMTLARGHKWVGHASMNISDTLDPLGNGLLGDWDNHVSWVPADVDGVAEKRVKGYAASSGGGNLSHIVHDVQYETYWPDHVIHIPDAGRDLLRAQAVWNEIRNRPRATYKMLTESCSTVVARVMRAAGFSGNAWTDHSLIWTPIKVRKFALAAGGTYLTFAQFAGHLVNAGLNDGSFSDPDTGLLISNTRDGQFTTLRGPRGPRHNPTVNFRP